MFTDEKRSDSEIQDAVKILFLGIAPEKSDELKRLWEQYQLQFCLCTDAKEVKMEGGAYRYVHFNHRALRVIWVSAFAAWEAYAYAQSMIVNDAPPSIDRLRDLLSLALKIRDADDPESVSLGNLPEPGTIPSDIEFRVPAELAMFAAGWAMLHEVRHLKHQQDFTAIADGDPPARAHAEELSCDKFAANYLLETASQYALAYDVDESTVRLKRSLGVYFGAFALIVLAYPNWEETESHPSISDRLLALRLVLSPNGLDQALCIAQLALVGLKQVWIEAPNFAN
ncbi:phage exclusion protein Lit family protein [Delftia sp. GW456-R20]|uniref:phage exclusion protein Lit family protein n=1 Tax=Delftia sp. GW456-R20 TaxID=1827145 RepID=UPI0009EEB113|nr:phage exclusion protein Lit family protein [Delftia sp. GW456-R20]